VKAILHTQYGPPDLLQFKEVDKPAPKDNEVLITIHATTVSSADCNVRNFTFVTKSMLPFAKLMFGIGKPWKERVLGTELAGEVEGAGERRLESPHGFDENLVVNKPQFDQRRVR
jgi:NADPH:quinone reductase-like Zn-dependent oxidoreductase